MEKGKRSYVKRVRVQDTRKYTHDIETLKQNIQALNENIGRLKQLGDFFPVDNVEGLKTISGAWLKEYTDGIIGEIRAEHRFTGEMKKELITRWQRLYDQAAPICDQVTLVAQFDGIPLQMADDGTFGYSDEAVKSFVADKSMVVLSQEESEYYWIIISIVNKLNQLSCFEKKHGFIEFTFDGAAVGTLDDYREFSLWDLIRLDEKNKFALSQETFARMILDNTMGKITRPTKFLKNHK